MENITSTYHSTKPTCSTFTRTDENGNVQHFHKYGDVEMLDLKIEMHPEWTLDSFTWSKPLPMKVQWDTESVDKLTAEFMDRPMATDPRVAEFKKQMDQEAQDTIGRFYDGSLSEDELGDAFRSLAETFAKGCWERGYPHPMWDIGSPTDQAALSGFYGEFRRMILQEAVTRNHAEGKRYVTGGLDMQKNYKYYNSDYYYKSEAAIKAATDAIQAIMDERGYDQFKVKDYKAEGLNEYYNFNTAFSNRFELSEQYMLDPDMPPPKNFQWFFQTGGNSSRRKFTMDACITRDAKGNIKEVEIYNPRLRFDPRDPRTANTWAAFTDENGQRHKISADFFFNNSNADLYNVGSLLQFGGEDAKGCAYAAVNRFLANLQAYPKGYFTRAGVPQTINLLV